MLISVQKQVKLGCGHGRGIGGKLSVTKPPGVLEHCREVETN